MWELFKCQGFTDPYKIEYRYFATNPTFRRRILDKR